MNSEIKTCQSCKQNFTIEPDDFSFYEKISVPPPTWCPECRLIRRLSWRNMSSLYKRACDLCKEEKIGAYAPDKPFNVYCSPCWWSDRWDGMDHGQEYDFDRPFFDQFQDLMKKVPLLSRFVYEDTMVRSDYSNMANNLKDCYLLFNSGGKNVPCERCAYGEQLDMASDCMDIVDGSHIELCFDSVNILNCYTIAHSLNCESCHDCWFVKNCSGCSNCFGCINLRDKSYHIFNQRYSKEEYTSKLKELGFDSGSFRCIEKFRQETAQWQLGYPARFYEGIQNLNVSGNRINYSKNAKESFFVRAAEHIRFCQFLFNVKDSYDWTQYGDGGELTYEVAQSGEGVHSNHFGWCIWRYTHDIEYGILNVTCSDCFGCIGLRNKQYCILNKQYSEEEYKNLRGRIIAQMKEHGEYGEYFPTKLSPWAYNESTAQDWFPLTETEAIKKGFQWTDLARFRGAYPVTMPADKIPDHINDTDDSILDEVLGCTECRRPYRLTKLEFAFYKRRQLPVPRKCFECRLKTRRQLRNPMKLWHRSCMNKGCQNEFETSYAPDRPEIVYCESCYQQEIM